MWKIYRHYKGALYLGYFRAVHSATEEAFQVYRCLYQNKSGVHWVRPEAMFASRDAAGPRFEELGTVEVAAPEDMAEVLMLGYDAWGEDQDEKSFVQSYERSQHHLRGRRYILRLASGTIVSGLNTLTFSRKLGGIASVATAPQQRGKGYASLLLKATFAILEDQQQLTRLLLFSEIDPQYYARLGFNILPTALQNFKPSLAMLRGDTSLAEDEHSFIEQYF